VLKNPLPGPWLRCALLKIRDNAAVAPESNRVLDPFSAPC
jgi:hypothetical protein